MSGGFAGARWWARITPKLLREPGIGARERHWLMQPPTPLPGEVRPAETPAEAVGGEGGAGVPGVSVPGWDDEVLEAVCQAYGLGTAADWEPPAGRTREKRVLLTAGHHQYLVRAVNGRTRGQLAVEAELDFREFLWRRHYPVGKLVRTSANARYLSIRGYHYVITLVENAQPYDASNLRHSSDAAAGLGQFHVLAQDFGGTSPLGATPYLTDIIDQRAAWIRAIASDRSVNTEAWGGSHHLKRSLLRARDELLSLLAGVEEAYEGQGPALVHGAYDQTALSFDALGLAEVGNLDQVGYDLRVADLARSLLAFCATADADGNCSDLDRGASEAFLAAYERVLPLTSLEAASLPLFLRAGYLAGVVDGCRRLLRAAVEDCEARNREARALSLALQHGPAAPVPRPEDSS